MVISSHAVVKVEVIHFTTRKGSVSVSFGQWQKKLKVDGYGVLPPSFHVKVAFVGVSWD